MCQDDNYSCVVFLFSQTISSSGCAMIMSGWWKTSRSANARDLLRYLFTSFENRTPFSHNPYKNYHHPHGNLYRHIDTHHHYPDQCLRPGLTTSAKERLEGSLVSKSWSTEGWVVIIFKYFSNMHKIFSRYVKSLVNNGTNRDFSKLSPIST